MITASEARKLVEQDELRNEALEACKASTEKRIKNRSKEGKTKSGPYHWCRYEFRKDCKIGERGKRFDFRDDMIRHLENHGYRVITKYNTNNVPRYMVMW